ncbi:hypothetical protein [Cryobacterium gelidum]|uniref:Uncharacterized protein n=1 Tax=Cryobacterium gelidum TaxID=1259164 RepID=A0A4R9ARB6_9MICO|nr:hypothetical protein [Cryobacterium gelidum]TFD68383.1 hypothetical protein E3T50_14710 [Cryobacterium gelidum]
MRERGTDLSLILLVRSNRRSPRLLALSARGFLGGFVTPDNYLGFRLANDSFNLAQAHASVLRRLPI